MEPSKNGIVFCLWGQLLVSLPKEHPQKKTPPAMFFNLHFTQKPSLKIARAKQTKYLYMCPANQINQCFRDICFLSITGRLRAGSNQKGTRISVYFKSLAFALKTYRSGSLWPTATPRLPAGLTPSKLSAKMQKKDQQQNLRLELSQRFAGH